MIYDICGYPGVVHWSRNIRNFPHDEDVTNGNFGRDLLKNKETSCE